MTDPLSVSASIAGLITLADILFRRTYKYVKAVKKASKEIKALSTELGTLYGILNNLNLVSHQLEDQTFESTTRTHHINSCIQTLERIRSILDRDDASSLSDQRLETLKRKLRWPFSSSEAKEVIMELERHKTTLGLALSADSWSGLLQALSRQDKLQNTVDGMRTELKERHEAETRIVLNKERQEVLKSFAKVDPRSNHDINRKLRSPGTGLWLTEGPEFRHWLETENARLWLYGIPGAGKTVLASSLIEEALRTSSPSSAVAFFYCDFKNPDTHDLSNILGSLAQQFAKQDKESFAQLRDFYENHNPDHRSDFKYDTDSLGTLIRAMTLVFDCAMIIVDGLDECGTNVPLVVDALTALDHDEHTTVKTILLSRDEIEIRERLEGYTQISIAARSSDLRLYVGAEMDLRTRQKKLRIKDQSLKEYVMERLVEGAEGMFRWVTCQMDYLCELPHDAARRKALDSLPPDLNSTYERILSRVNHSNSETQKMVRRALRWITCQHSYLRIDALCEAISINFGDTRRNCQAIPDEFDILKWCSSLVRRSADGKTLELAHFTVQEFLEQIDPQQNISIGAYRIDRESDRLILAKVCLTYLNFQDFDQSGPFSQDVVKRRSQEYPFRRYAVHDLYAITGRIHHDAELFIMTQNLFSPSKPGTFISWVHDFVVIFADERKLQLPKKHDFINFVFVEATPLHFAAMLNLNKLCSWLIESGCDVNRNSNFGTPLHCALCRWHILYAILIDGENLLSYPVFNGDTVEVLLESGADPNSCFVRDTLRLSPLFLALSYGHDDLAVQLLLKGGLLDSACLDILEGRSSRSEDFSGVLDHTSGHNVSQDNHDRLSRLALREGISNQTRPIPKDAILPGLNTYALRTAAEFGQKELVISLLENHRPDIDAVYEATGMTALHFAVRTNQLGVVQILIDRGANVNTTDGLGRTALHYCVRTREVGCLQLLLERHADTSLRDLKGMTVWHRASQNRNVQALTILLSMSHGTASSIGLKANDGRTPLLCASANGSEEAIRLLLSAGSTLTETASDGSSSLHYAVSSGSLEAVKFLISEAVESGAVTQDGSNAIHCAVRGDGQKLAEIVQVLLEAGVDPCKARNNGYTPLYDLVRIIREGSLSSDRLDCLFDVSRVLIKNLHGTSRLVSNARLGSELIYLACSKSFPSAHDTVLALLECGLDSNTLFADGRTALMPAAEHGDIAILSTLLLHGADPCISSLSYNVLHCACFNDHRDILVRLRETSIDWNSKITTKILGARMSHVTALHIAARYEDSDMSEYLLTEKLITNIDARTSDGATPLIVAAVEHKSRNVFLLLSNGADATAVNDNGESAVHWAARYGYDQVISEFISNRSDLGLPNRGGLNPELVARKFGHEALANNIMDYVNDQENTSSDLQNSQRSDRTNGTLEALKIAIDIGDLQLCTRLVENGIDLSSGFESCMGCTPLLYSLAMRKCAIAEYLVSQGASTAGSMCKSCPSDSTVFHYAVSSGSVKLLQLLLDTAPSEIYINHAALHPIHLAVYNNHVECVKMTLDHVSQGKGRTTSDQLGTLQEALDRMANMQVWGEMFHWDWFPKELETAHPLHIAASRGHSQMVQILLEYGAHIDGEDTYLRTPLHYAARAGDTLVIELLLGFRANPNAVDTSLQSPCMVAAEWNHVDSIHLLKRGGGDIGLRDIYGQTALSRAASVGAFEVFVYLMNTTDVNDLDEEDMLGLSILNRAICDGIQIPMVYLLNLAPPARVYEPRRNNILTEAVEYRSSTDVKMLTRRIPNDILPRLLDYRAPSNGTPLYAAAVLSRVVDLNLLLDVGAQLEVEGSEHGTPLMAACATGRLKAVKVLVARGARTSYVKDGQIYSAFLAAKHHPAVRRWLLVGRFMEGPKLLTY